MIVIESVVLLEINYCFEWWQEKRDGSVLPHFLLFGESVPVEGEDSENDVMVEPNYHITKCCSIPDTLDKIHKRIQLLKEVDADLIPCAVLQVSKGRNRIIRDPLIQTVCSEVLMQPIWISYFPSRQNSLHLSIQLGKNNVPYEISSPAVDILPKTAHDNADVVRDLLSRIDKILLYLNKARGTYSDDKSLYDIILRKLQVLICYLGRETTHDISQLIQREEMEIMSLMTVLNQWEIVNIEK